MADSLDTRTAPEIQRAIIAAMPNIAAVVAHVEQAKCLSAARKALIRVQAELECFDTHEVPAGIEPDDVTRLLADLEDRCFAFAGNVQATNLRDLSDKLQIAAALHRLNEPNAPADDPMAVILASCIRDASGMGIIEPISTLLAA